MAGPVTMHIRDCQRTRWDRQWGPTQATHGRILGCAWEVPFCVWRCGRDNHWIL